MQGAILNLNAADDRIVKAMDELQDIVSKVYKNSLQ
jgi:nucleoid-associated protein YgaU